jgi:tetratricopeptide (TPR) repeat protein
MPVWKNLIDQLNNQPQKNYDQLLELINYQYGYIGWCLENKRKDEASDYLKLAEANVKLLEAGKFGLSLVNAYKAAFYGYHIAINKFSAPFNGPKSSACANQAILLDPNQPFGYIQLGNAKFHAPSLMGGSKTEAIIYYLKARAMMEIKKEEIVGDWNYLSLLTTIAKAYESIGELSKAKLCYEEILKLEPGFTWVRDELYPQLLKKL